MSDSGKVHIADKETLDEVNNKIGTASDGEASTPTTLFAGIKKLLSLLSDHITNWTAARAAKIDSIDTNAARLTDTRAGYIDKLANGTYGLEVLKNKILENRDYYISYGTNATFFTSGQITGGREVYTGNFIAQEDGDYRVDFSVTIKNNSANTELYGTINANLSYVGNNVSNNNFYHADNYDAIISPGGSRTFTVTTHCYMQKAIPVRFLISSNYNNAAITLNSLTVKGNKVQNKM